MQAELDYVTTIQRVIARIRDTQRAAIAEAADLAAAAIAEDGWCNLFGTGHSHLPCLEAYPRIGGIVGFRPMVELALATPNYMVNDNGLLQGTFLEQVEGYGDVIMQSHAVQPPDCMVVFSNSGVNAVPVDVALGCRARGVPVIAVTSREHAASTGSRHSSGKTLADVADVVIDNCVPPGDAQVRVAGMDHPVGGCSTIASMTIVQMIVAGTAERLTAKGIQPTVIHSHNRHDTGEGTAHSAMEESVQAYGRRLGRRMTSYETALRRTGQGSGQSSGRSS